MARDLAKLAPFDDEGALRFIKPEVSNRIIAMPHRPRPLARLGEARALPAPARRQTEQFFTAAAAMTAKRLTCSGGATGRATERFIAANLA